MSDGSDAPQKIKRDAAATRKRILDAARQAFAQSGFRGARIDQISKAARANVQMIYRYFGSKEGLYIHVLEDIYFRIRARELRLKLRDHPPVEGVQKLVEFTFDYLSDHPEFVAIIRNENMDGGHFARQLQKIPGSATRLLETLNILVKRGAEQDKFRQNIDPLQLYVTIVALCIIHLAQRDTLSVMLNQDLESNDWISERRYHVVDVILSYLRAVGATG